MDQKENGGTAVSASSNVRQWLMTGVSYMIPFVTAGGILIALGFALGGAVEVTQVSFADAIATNNIPVIIFQLGATAFGYLVPALAAYIAYAIADRPGIAPGFVAGALAGTTGAGFLGGLIGGLIAGLIARQISSIDVPGAIRSLMPIVVTPLVTTLITGFLMIYVVGNIVTPINEGATEWLNGLGGGSLAVLGVILGLMMAFDMGGPVNKVAYTFGAAGLSAAGTAIESPAFVVMAAIMAAGMTPPLGLALATVLRPKLFSESEIENGKAAWVLGASFITEGAIPFAAADPLRVIPSLMAGSAVAGALVGTFGNTLRAPHGGIWVIGTIGAPLTYFLAIAIGTAVTAFAVIAAKGIGSKAE